MTLYIDTETFSELPIRVGAQRYARSCEVMIVSYAIDDGDAQAWEPAIAPKPADLEDALDSDCTIVAHNVGFDCPVLAHGLGISPTAERWHCTMAQAMAHSLPAKLELLCHLFGLKAGDSKVDGKDLINLFCMPRPKTSKIRRATRETHPTEWAAFVHYAKQDVVATRVLYKAKLPTWNYGGDGHAGRHELALWRLDQRINERGIAVDVEFSTAAVAELERIGASLAAQTEELTAGAVESATQRDKLLKHLLAEYGIALPDMQASTLERRMEDPDLPEPVKELIALRLESSLTAGKKHKAVLASVCEDGRLRGLLRFCGAGRTGRWSGQVFQPQNLVRPPKYLKGEKYDAAIEDIKAGRTAEVHERPMEVISGTVRGVLVPAPGRRFALADLSNIEGRMLAWQAGEQWKLDAYARGEDLYKIAYGKTFGQDPATVDEDQRQIGKVEELALGYQGAVGAFTQMAAAYGLDLPEDFVVQLVKGWRKANPAIASYWYEAEDVVRHAIQNPGTTLELRRLRVVRRGSWLRVQLPSGRCLCYPHPRLDEQGKIVYDGMNQYTRKWGPIKTYGGKLVENFVQAAARDVIADALPRIEAAGYDVVMLVHDENICEVDLDSPLNGEILAHLMCEGIIWAEGLPLAAVGKDLDRYRKA